MSELVVLGCLLQDGEGVPVPNAEESTYQYKAGAALELSDTPADFNYAIRWAPVHTSRGEDILVADRVLLTGLCYYDLDRCGLVLGKDVLLDGMRFEARLLTELPDGFSEWSETMALAGKERADVLHAGHSDLPFWLVEGSVGGIGRSMGLIWQEEKIPKIKTGRSGYRPVLVRK